jgi:hypothetical protein
VVELFQTARYRRAWIPIAYGLTLLLLSPLHAVFSEYTGPLLYFSGKELVAGAGYHGWASQFWPPLFPLVVGILARVWTGFFAAKFISIVSGSLLLWVSYDLTADFFHDAHAPLWTQAFLASSPVYLSESLAADNHMLDAFLFNCGLLLFLRSARKGRPAGIILAGVVCGLAGLTRYTSYVLLLLPCFFLAALQMRTAWRCSVAFVAGFAAVSLPWWIYNAAYNGSPLHTLEYLNVYAGLFGKDRNSLLILWHLMEDPQLKPSAIFVANARAYASNLVRNIPEAFRLLFAMAGVLGPLVTPGVLLGALQLETSAAVAVAGVLLASVLTVSQAYVNTYMLLPWTPLVVMASVTFLLVYLGRLGDRFAGFSAVAGRAVLGLLLLGNLVLCGRAVRAYQRELLTDRSLADVTEITRVLRQHDAFIRSKVIMAIDPARAYYAGSKFLATPFDYEGPVRGLVDYRGVSPRLTRYAPKYPSDMDTSGLRADYLIYTRRDESNRWGTYDPPQFAFLLDPQSGLIPHDFNLIYRSANAVVYEVNRTGTIGPER